MSEWTEPMKALCSGRCGDVGDPPCWELPDLSSDCDDVEPCTKCTADRIAALEAELQDARMQGLAAAGQAQDHMEKVAALEAENERLRKMMAPMAVTGVGPDGEWRAVPLEDWLARAALQENDNA